MSFLRPYGLAGIPIVLDSGTVVELPDDWPDWSAQQRIDWISQSALSAADASTLEAEAGLDTAQIYVGGGDEGDPIDVLQMTGGTAARVSNATELSKLIPKNGSLRVPADSSALKVARDNWLQFSVSQDSSDATKYLITSRNLLLYGGVAAAALFALIALTGGRH